MGGTACCHWGRGGGGPEEELTVRLSGGSSVAIAVATLDYILLIFITFSVEWHSHSLLTALIK